MVNTNKKQTQTQNDYKHFEIYHEVTKTRYDELISFSSIPVMKWN